MQHQFAAMIHLLAQAAPVVPASSAASIITALLSNGQLMTALYAVAASVAFYWKHKQATGYKAALGAVVVGTEAFVATPEGQAVEDKLKSTIQATAEKHGAEGILHEAVTLLTPAATAAAATLTATISPPSTP